MARPPDFVVRVFEERSIFGVFIMARAVDTGNFFSLLANSRNSCAERFCQTVPISLIRSGFFWRDWVSIVPPLPVHAL